jgi:hypothetical protein
VAETGRSLSPNAATIGATERHRSKLALNIRAANGFTIKPQYAADGTHTEYPFA